ncbi:MAG: ATP synthase F1 subunit delta [Flavobacteriales bacterium]
MKITKAANRYAKSLLDLSVEKGNVEEVYEDMSNLAKTVAGSKELRVMLNSPVIKPDSKAKVLTEVFSGQVSEMTSKFISLITEKGRESLLGGIANGFVLQYKAYKNVSQAEVVSAAPLDADSKAKVEAILQKLAPGLSDLTETINPELIGGYIIKVGDQMIDASVSSKLRELRRELSENLYVPGF